MVHVVSRRGGRGGCGRERQVVHVSGRRGGGRGVCGRERQVVHVSGREGYMFVSVEGGRWLQHGQNKEQNNSTQDCRTVYVNNTRSHSTAPQHFP